MAKQVKFGGSVHAFPDDATDDEIRSALEAEGGGAPPPPAAAPAAPPPSLLDRAGQFVGGVARRAKGAVSGMWDQATSPIRHEVQSVQDALDTNKPAWERVKAGATAAAEPFLTPFRQAQDVFIHGPEQQAQRSLRAANAGRPVMAAVQGALTPFPVIGPQIGDLLERAPGDPYGVAGEAAFDAGSAFLGPKLARAAGNRLATAATPPPPGPIPGASATAMETSSSFPAALANRVSASPAAQAPVSAFLKGRDAAVVGEGGRLLDAIEPAPRPVTMPQVRQAGEATADTLQQQAEQEFLQNSRRAQRGGESAAQGEIQRAGGVTGEAAGNELFNAVNERLGRARARESDQWNTLIGETESRGIRPTLARTSETAGPMLEGQKQAHEIGASGVSPSTEQILTRAGKPVAQPVLPAATQELIAGMPPEAQQFVMQQLGPDAATGSVSFKALKEARSKVGRLKSEALTRASMGSPDTHVLQQLYDAMGADMRASLAEHPELAEGFDVANNLTKARFKVFDKEGSPVQKMLQHETPLQPSQVPGKVASGTVEGARNMKRALGANASGQRALRSSLMEELLGKRKAGVEGAKTVNYVEVLDELDTNPVYKEVLGSEFRPTRARIEAQANAQKAGVPSVVKQTTQKVGSKILDITAESGKPPSVKARATPRAAVEQIMDKASGGKMGASSSTFNGPGFARAYRAGRGKLADAGVPPAQLADLDKFSDEVAKYTLKSKRHGFDTSGLPTGVPWYLVGKRALVKIMLHPEGPGLLARSMKAGKWAKDAGEISARLAQIAGAEGGVRLKFDEKGNLR